jgi:hypothetical protein
VATDKVTADKAAAKKVDVDKAAATKATEEAMAKAAVDVVVMKTAGQGVQWHRPPRDRWGLDPAPLLARRWDPRGWLRWVAPLLLPSGSAALGNLGT